MNVTKYDGTLQKFDIIKIRERIEYHAKDLDINTLELESSIDLVFFDGIETHEIQKNLVYHALSFATDIQSSDWRLMAARLDISDFNKTTSRDRGFLYGDVLSLIKTNIGSGLYSDYIMTQYEDEDIIELSKKLIPDRDYIFDYAGISSMKKRYLKKNETIQEMFLIVSMIIASKSEDKMLYTKMIYDFLSLKQISLATPLLGNLRIKDGNLSSCFVTKMDDNIESIYNKLFDIALISKNGGGVGLNVSDLRAKGSYIKNVANASGGPVPFIKVLNDSMIAVNQLGSRVGAATVALDSWHLDIEEFIELQSETGDLRRKAHDIFPQVVLSDEFMRRVEDGEEWYLFDPKETLDFGYDLSSLYGEAFTDSYNDLIHYAKIGDIKLFKVVEARDILTTIMKTWVETGLPYVAFKDTINEANPLKNSGVIRNTNLCVESYSPFDGELTHTCNLLSINLAVDTGYSIEAVSEMAVHIMDNTIELTNSPIDSSRLHNEKFRTIGIGYIGYADYLAKKNIPYENSVNEANSLFEKYTYNIIKSSNQLAEKRGSFNAFEGSDWYNGVMIDKYIEKSKDTINDLDWEGLQEDINKFGMRNGLLCAIAPNSGTSLLMGTSASVLPPFSKFYIEKNAKGSYPVCPPFIKTNMWSYKEYKKCNTQKVTDVISTIQKWIDTGISYELSYDINDDINAKEIYDDVIHMWKSKIKAIYYVRFIQKSTSEEACSSCAN